MFDLTLPGQAGLFIGAWGFSNAPSRLTGTVLGDAVRDLFTTMSSNPLTGYLVVFAIEAGLLLIAVFLLMRIDVKAFHASAMPPPIDRVAMID